MRRATLVLLAAMITATPATAQQSPDNMTMDPATTDIADPSLSAGANEMNAGVGTDMPGLAGGPQEIQGPATTAPAPDLTDVTVTPETGEGPGFAWGLLGLLGLAGLIGRFRSRSREN